MGNSIKTQSPDEVFDPQLESFKYQLEFLKLEIECINSTIARFDEITQTTKNWAIVTWASSIALGLGQPDLRKYTILTALLPLLFWNVDAWWRHLLRRSGFRVIKIREFLNDERLVKSFEQKKLVGFTVYDPTGRQHRGTEEYKKYTSVSSTFRFREVGLIYLGLFGISLVLGVFFLLVP